jgi:hypothetical protein
MNLVCLRDAVPRDSQRARNVETPLRAPVSPTGMVQVDPVLVGIVAVMLFVVLFLFLLFRRVMKGFTDGLREGQRRD